jgi:hypothetical protein
MAAVRFAAAVALSLVSAAAQAAEIGYDGARHLLNRVGFGATDAEIREYAPLDRGEAVNRLLAGARRESFVQPPALVGEPFTPYYKLRGMSAEERMAAQRTLIEQGFELRVVAARDAAHAEPAHRPIQVSRHHLNHFRNIA